MAIKCFSVNILIRKENPTNLDVLNALGHFETRLESVSLEAIEDLNLRLRPAEDTEITVYMGQAIETGVS